MYFSFPPEITNEPAIFSWNPQWACDFLVASGDLWSTVHIFILHNHFFILERCLFFPQKLHKAQHSYLLGPQNYRHLKFNTLKYVRSISCWKRFMPWICYLLFKLFSFLVGLVDLLEFVSNYMIFVVHTLCSESV